MDGWWIVGSLLPHDIDGIHMGKLVGSDFKQKHPKNRGTKSNLIFDDESRADFLTGFRRRKNERRKKAQEEIIKKLKDQKRRVREQKKTKRLKEVSDVVAALDGQALTESKTLNLASHTVTITDVSSVDFIGSTGVMLGSNTDTQEPVRTTEITDEEDEKCLKSDGKEVKPSKTQIRKIKEREKKLRKALKHKKSHQHKHKLVKTKKKKT